MSNSEDCFVTFLVDDSATTIIHSMPIHIWVEIVTLLFAGSILRTDIQNYYKDDVYPLLMALPRLWNELMMEPKFRFWYIMMKTRYYRDIHMRTFYAVPSRLIIDDQRRNRYRFRKRCDEDKQRVYVVRLRSRKKNGPVIRDASYYNIMKQRHVMRFQTGMHDGWFQTIAFVSPSVTEKDLVSNTDLNTNNLYMMFYRHLVKKYCGRAKKVSVSEIESEFDGYHYKKKTTTK